MTTATRLNTAHHALQWLGSGALLLTLALPGSEALAAGIADTRHNLTSSNSITGANHVTNADAEICVFCHTPHMANQSGSNPLPLWNRTSPATGGYTTYSTTTMDAPAADFTGSTSLACLSCHDGTQAMDTVINKPGFGGYAAAGTSMGYTWTGSRQSSGQMTNDLAGGYIAMLNDAASLSNDHPIAIPYCGGSSGSGTTYYANCKDKDFNAPTRTSATVWFVDTGDGTSTTKDAVRQRTDIILYPRTDVPYVECASCHDPHVPDGTDPVTGNPRRTFLRIANANSAVCLACHNK